MRVFKRAPIADAIICLRSMIRCAHHTVDILCDESVVTAGMICMPSAGALRISAGDAAGYAIRQKFCAEALQSRLSARTTP